MASVSQVALCRLLLRRIDRHPIGIVDGNDLVDIDRATVDLFLARRLLVERAPLGDIGGRVIQQDGERTTAVDIDGEDVARDVSPLALRHYDIEIEEVCGAIRKGAGLAGLPVEAIGANTYWLGALGTGSRRIEYYVARLFRADDAVDRALALKARSNGQSLVVFTPTSRELPARVQRQLLSEKISIASIEGALVTDASHPFEIALPAVAWNTETATVRLSVDVAGKIARFDGKDLPLTNREFAVLVALANERVEGDGYVSRDRLAEALSAAAPQGERNDEQIEKVTSSLRRKLRTAGVGMAEDARAPIKSGRGLGYRLDFPATVLRVF